MTRQVRKPEPLKVLFSTPATLKANGEELKQTKVKIEATKEAQLAFNTETFEDKQAKINQTSTATVQTKEAELAVINAQIADLLKQLQVATVAQATKKAEISAVSKATQKEIEAAKKLKAEFDKRARSYREADLKDANKQALADNLEAVGKIFGEMAASGVYVTDGAVESLTKVTNGIKNVVGKIGENYKEGYEAPTKRKVPNKLQPK